jgi:thiol-disulfide isomerase/thioredoxin
MTPFLLALFLAAPPTGFDRAKVDAGKLADEAARVAKSEASKGRHVLVVFGAPWCGACHVVDRAIEQLEKDPLSAKWALVEVDVDDLPDGPALGLPFDEIPYLVRLDDQGRPAGTLQAGEVLGHRKGQGISALRRFLGT